MENYWPWMKFDDGIADDYRGEFLTSLKELGEYYALGFFEEKAASLYRRYARALICCAESMPLMSRGGQSLYPATDKAPKDMEMTERYVSQLWNWYDRDCRKMQVFRYHYNYPLHFDNRLCMKTLERAGDFPAHRKALQTLQDFYFGRMEILTGGQSGSGWTHCVVNYERVLKEGLNGYRGRIEDKLKDCDSEENRELYESLLIVIQAAEVLRDRFVGQVGGDIELKKALGRVPFEPARNFYEAMVCVNFIFYFEGCDSPGRMDQYLYEYYRRDKEAGKICDDEVIELLRAFWTNMDNLGAWNVAIGGRGEVNELTYQILESVKGFRRPNLALRIPKDADDKLWDSAFDSLATGTGIPALYNDDEYIEALKNYELGLSETDVRQFCFGGCTETMVQGCSNVGSLATVLHMLKVFEETLRSWLFRVKSFSELMDRYFDALRERVDCLCDWVNQNSELKARYQPQLIRSLLVDDCIDEGVEFFRGGARYNWEVVGLTGFSNVVDSLFAVKSLVFDRRKISGRKMLQVLADNYDGYGDLLAKTRHLPKYGQGVAEVDVLAGRVAEFTFNRIRTHAAWRGGKFLASCLMFETYGDYGKIVEATPDGRLAGEPLGDSFGAYQGRDINGPTALLNSVTSFPHRKAPGTLVINIRFDKEVLTKIDLRAKLKDLLKTYFSRGGMQIQITSVDQKVLQDAIRHPERHENLIIRIGGYSAYFNDLSEELKVSVLERSSHG